MKEAKTTIRSIRKSGAHLYLPSSMVKDSAWPFNREKNTKVKVRIQGKKLIVE